VAHIIHLVNEDNFGTKYFSVIPYAYRTEGIKKRRYTNLINILSCKIAIYLYFYWPLWPLMAAQNKVNPSGSALSWMDIGKLIRFLFRMAPTKEYYVNYQYRLHWNKRTLRFEKRCNQDLTAERYRHLQWCRKFTIYEKRWCFFYDKL